MRNLPGKLSARERGAPPGLVPERENPNILANSGRQYQKYLFKFNKTAKD